MGWAADRRPCHPKPVVEYSENVSHNVDFLGDRARDLAADELDRSKTLDAKATALIAGCVALIAAGAAFASRLADVPGGEGAKLAWAIELAAALALIFVAAGLAVWALVPKAVRSAVGQTEVDTWANPRTLERAPTLVRGTMLRADAFSVGHARRVSQRKADRLRAASWVFAAALACIVTLTIHLAFHAALEAADDRKPRAAPHQRA